MRDVTIRKVMNGLVVTVGCQTLVFNDTEDFLRGLREYITDPERTERFWIEKFGMQHGADVAAPIGARRQAEQAVANGWGANSPTMQELERLGVVQRTGPIDVPLNYATEARTVRG